MIATLKYIVLASALLFGLGATVYVHVQAETVGIQKIKEAEAIWIDVRTPAEFESGHVSDALNIEYQNLGSAIVSIAPDKNAPINLYCRSGRRSEIAKQTLLNMGYTNVINKGAYDMVKKMVTQN